MALGDIKAELSRAAGSFVENLYHCSRCNYCVEAHWEERRIQHVCPTLIYHSPALGYSGKGYLASARAVLEGEELPVSSLVERFFTCTTCGNCEEVCPVGLRPAQLVRRMREALVARDLVPEALATLRARMAEHHNPCGYPAQARDQWATGLEGLADDAPILYVAGCAACYDSPGEARATVSVLHRVGVRLRLPVSVEPRCCGAPLSEVGYTSEAQAERLGLLKIIQRANCRAVVVSGAECLEELRKEAALQGVEVSHAFDVLEREIAGGRASLRLKETISMPLTVGCLDACHLSKKSHGQAAADYPRRLRRMLSSLGCKLVEVADEANYAVCCGAAGGMPEMNPESAARAAAGRLESFGRAGAALVVSPSPLCASHLRRSRDASLPKVMGLFEFIDTYFESRG